jgi:co-chaperonin GroES (HSP10)
MIKAVGKNVIVLGIKPEETTESGLHIPQTAMKSERFEIGTVLSIGATDEPFDVEVGDKVYFDEFAGRTLEAGNPDDDLLILGFVDVLARDTRQGD